MSIVAEVDHTRGDTFAWTMAVVGADPITAVKSQVRTSAGDLLSEVICEAVSPTSYNLIVLDTSNWPVAELQMDIQLTMGAIIKSSGVIQINVQRDVTKSV